MCSAHYVVKKKKYIFFFLIIASKYTFLNDMNDCNRLVVVSIAGTVKLSFSQESCVIPVKKWDLKMCLER